MTKGEHLDLSFHAKGAVIIDLFNGTWIPLAVVRTNGTNHILGESTSAPLEDPVALEVAKPIIPRDSYGYICG